MLKIELTLQVVLFANADIRVFDSRHVAEEYAKASNTTIIRVTEQVIPIFTTALHESVWFVQPIFAGWTGDVCAVFHSRANLEADIVALAQEWSSTDFLYFEVKEMIVNRLGQQRRTTEMKYDRAGKLMEGSEK